MRATACKKPLVPSLEDFVGTHQYNLRHGKKIESLCGLEIERHFVLARRSHREIAWLCALKNAIDVVCCAPELIEKSRPVGDETTGGNVKAVGIDRGLPMPCRKIDYQLAINRCVGAGDHDETAIWLGCEFSDRAPDFSGIPHFDRAHRYPEGGRQSLNCSELGRNPHSHTGYAQLPIHFERLILRPA